MPRVMRCDALSVTHNTALITWAANDYITPKLRYSSLESEQVLSFEEPASLGRFYLHDLRSDCTYTYSLDTDEGRLAVGEFTTLPAPAGAPLWRYAIVADPHYSTSHEDPNGRLSTESDTLLRETVTRVSAMGVEVLFVPGDLTEHGLPEEFEGCLRILSHFPGKVIAVLGNHDLESLDARGDPATIMPSWMNDRMIIGGARPDSACFALTWRGISIIGVDSSGAAIGQQQQKTLAQHLSRAGREVILISHRSLFPQPGLVDGSGVVEDWQNLEPLFNDGGHRIVAYVGHKHVARQLRTGSLYQVHVPQLIEYPCGFAVVEVYADRFRQILSPIASEALIEFSRLGCLSTGKPNYKDVYRHGELSDRCFDIPRNE